ncbi:hypothetical protein [Agrobacterium cavarae]|jgi:chromosomal replication initiation ATPase DnaA|uniref:hypothetical protein n=1 Tax=Agrobacterium cavarae TaxID=2528239 RepID=UPI003D0694C5
MTFYPQTQTNFTLIQTNRVDGFMRLVTPLEYRARESMADAVRHILDKHPHATLHLVRSDIRTRWLVRIRMELIVYFRDVLGKTYPQIAKFLQRDHTSVLHLYRKAKAEGAKQ